MGVLIPLSIVMLVYASATDVSVGLFVTAGVAGMPMMKVVRAGLWLLAVLFGFVILGTTCRGFRPICRSA
ncbi:hypothetical protein [Actibacterium lipolyticum]|uniref:hypothetical protein n=1 Tax=Actibacterium lipolyticum TaxID=1524263 RepID=UPI0011311A01